MIRHLRVVALAAIAAMAAAAPAAAEILIAVSGPMKGQYASFGEQALRGADAAVKAINAAGGVLGEQVKLEAQDDACDARRAVEIAKDLGARGAKLVVGPYCSIAAIAAASSYAESGIVMISPAATNPKYLNAGLWNTHSVSPPDDAQGAFAGARLAKEFGGKRVVIVRDETPYAEAVAAAVKRGMNGAALSEVSFETYEHGKADFPALAQKIKLAAPDAIYIAGSPVDAGTFMKALRAADVKAPAFGPDALAAEDFWPAAGEAGQGLELTFPPDPQRLDAAKEAVAAYIAANTPPEGPTLQAQAAVELWAAAVKAINSADGRRVAEWLRAGNRVKTVVGEVSLGPKGDRKDPAFLWLKWSNGEIAETP